ncbi:MAG: hypothetical protein KAJ33_05990 [Thermoplasmata archaeon]|nr:hypothetical protein [Thermoplasmata archaeon]
MNITQATKRACEEPTLLDALSWICIWESERVVRQARENEQWETCFHVCLKSVMESYGKNTPPETTIVDLAKHKQKVEQQKHKDAFEKLLEQAKKLDW